MVSGLGHIRIMASPSPGCSRQHSHNSQDMETTQVSVNGRTDKVWCVRECVCTQWNATPLFKTCQEFLSFVKRCMNLGGIMLSDNKSEKDTFCNISHMEPIKAKLIEIE